MSGWCPRGRPAEGIELVDGGEDYGSTYVNGPRDRCVVDVVILMAVHRVTVLSIDFVLPAVFLRRYKLL